ncbi:unnamed protein product [Schistosoma mattheei]|uniref:Reverse transcriptase domain-containing protein n=1 Tax=Schistosoma mattheei TaxID=31246 RepID=A0A183NWI1_9TREM|nr:unnamed protein product [Schistosoma mattheei]
MELKTTVCKSTSKSQSSIRTSRLFYYTELKLRELPNPSLKTYKLKLFLLHVLTEDDDYLKRLSTKPLLIPKLLSLISSEHESSKPLERTKIDEENLLKILKMIDYFSFAQPIEMNGIIENLTSLSTYIILCLEKLTKISKCQRILRNHNGIPILLNYLRVCLQFESNLNNPRSIRELSNYSVYVNSSTNAVNTSEECPCETKLLRDQQAGLRKDTLCTDQIPTPRIIVEKSIEWNSSLYINFIDYEKAFDSVDRTTLWKLFRHYGVPQKIVNIIRNSYAGLNCEIVHGGQLTKSFEVKTGVRQGCLLSFFLFLLVIDWITKTSTSEGNDWTQWTSRMQLDDLNFACDLALLSQLQQQMQEKTNSVAAASAAVGLNIHEGKSRILRYNTACTNRMTLDGEDLEDVKTFTNLGSIIDERSESDANVKAWIGKARAACLQMRNIWNSKQLLTNTKVHNFDQDTIRRNTSICGILSQLAMNDFYAQIIARENGIHLIGSQLLIKYSKNVKNQCLIIESELKETNNVENQQLIDTNKFGLGNIRHLYVSYLFSILNIKLFFILQWLCVENSTSQSIIDNVELRTYVHQFEFPYHISTQIQLSIQIL